MAIFASTAEIAELRARNAALTAQLADVRAELDLEREARRSDAAAARKEREMLTDRLLVSQGGVPVYQPLPAPVSIPHSDAVQSNAAPAGRMVPFDMVKSRVEAMRQKASAPTPRGVV